MPSDHARLLQVRFRSSALRERSTAVLVRTLLTAQSASSGLPIPASHPLKGHRRCEKDEPRKRLRAVGKNGIRHCLGRARPQVPTSVGGSHEEMSEAKKVDRVRLRHLHVVTGFGLALWQMRPAARGGRKPMPSCVAVTMRTWRKLSRFHGALRDHRPRLGQIVGVEAR
jgi:hypothetical protein